MHFFGLCCVIISQCTVQRNVKVASAQQAMQTYLTATHFPTHHTAHTDACKTYRTAQCGWNEGFETCRRQEKLKIKY